MCVSDYPTASRQQVECTPHKVRGIPENEVVDGHCLPDPVQPPPDPVVSLNKYTTGEARPPIEQLHHVIAMASKDAAFRRVTKFSETNNEHATASYPRPWRNPGPVHARQRVNIKQTASKTYHYIPQIRPVIIPITTHHNPGDK